MVASQRIHLFATTYGPRHKRRHESFNEMINSFLITLKKLLFSFNPSMSIHEQLFLSKFRVIFPELLTGILLKIHQFKAMFMKRFIHSKRNKTAVITQLILPILMTIFGLALGKAVPRIKNEPSRELNFKNLSVDGRQTYTLYASFSQHTHVTFQVQL